MQFVRMSQYEINLKPLSTKIEQNINKLQPIKFYWSYINESIQYAEIDRFDWEV